MTDTQTAEKTRLLGLLDRLRDLAIAEGFDMVLDEAEDLRQKLAADRFEIAVLGQFKRGKSSLINALVGADVLPTGSVPLTSVMTVVRHSEKPAARVVFRKKDPLDVALDQLPLFITEKGNPKNQKNVVRVEVGVDSPFLSAGDVLVDTPGVGSTHAHNTQAAYDTLPRADAVLYVLSVDPPVGEEDLKFLVSIRQHVSKIFFVLNKRDYLPDREFEENRAFTDQILRDTLQVDAVSLFPVSARWAREGKEGHGVSDLELHLKEFLRTGKGRQVLDRTARRAEEAARGALAMVELEHRAYTGKSIDLETKAWSLSSYINNVFMEGAQAKRRLKAAFEAYEAIVQKAVRSHCAAAARSIARDLQRAAAGSSHVKATDLREMLARLQQAKAKESLKEFFREKETWMAHGFQKIRQDYEGRLLHQLDAVWKIAADLFGSLPAADLPTPVEPSLGDVFIASAAASPLPERVVRALAKPSAAAEKEVRAKVEAGLRKAADGIVANFLKERAAQMAEAVAALEKMSRQAQELADRAVKVVVQRQTANEAEVIQKLSAIRHRLTAAQGLFNEITALRRT